ncbi:alpha beta hydrolase family [Chlorella sorokiniana]|uniref:Alpha beta hydrolase family n=1 Tax=Chlorella sorokiniana TaxID=3076 RepID=A0A2P6TWU9_CHLSO|nr:alpha beta hydrolase family [Chlorella sorokiniana]|eukprot:PRW58543.1 alpha beta hydrolase family [Chlorella sorokiniana]
MHSLHRRMCGQAGVVCVSNLGMDAQGLTPRGRVFSLEEQIQHKVHLLRERFAGPGRPPVVVLAHSIGCYMSIHAVHRLENHHLYSSQAATAAVDSVARQHWQHPDQEPAAAAAAGPAVAGAPSEAMQEPADWDGREAALMQGMQEELVAARSRQQGQAGTPPPDGQASGSGSSSGSSSGGGSSGGSVIKVVGMYPFLTVDPDCSHQRRLSQLTRHHKLLSRLAGGVGALPFGLRRGLVRLVAPQLEPHAVDTTVKVFTSATAAENGLYMGLTEFETLAAPAQWWLLEALGPRFAVFVAPGDTWFKKWKWDLMHKEVPGVESHWVDTQTHAFCVSQAQSDELAERIVPIVEAALQPAAQAVSRL